MRLRGWRRAGREPGEARDGGEVIAAERFGAGDAADWDEEQSEEETIEARCVVNSAGLYADEVAGMLGPRPWKIYPVRGSIARFAGRGRI